MNDSAYKIWRENAPLGTKGVLDWGDTRGLKNKYIDLAQKIVLKKEVRFSENDKILDFGCGSGRLSKWLINFGVDKIVGIDITNEMIEEAKKNCSSFQNVNFLPYDGQTIPFPDGYFTKIFSIGVLSLVLDDNAFQNTIKEINRVLKKNGLFFFIENISSSGVFEKYCGEDFKLLRTLEKYVYICKKIGFKLITYYPVNTMKGFFYKKYVIQRKLHFWTRLVSYIGIRFDIYRARRLNILKEDYIDCLFVFEKIQ
jgi:ubiquinone/menaquinone biosynthesis C-methylase UbiE